MKKLCSLFLLCYFTAAIAQDVKPKETSLEFYGFVRFESHSDSYKGVNAANEQFYVVPLYAGAERYSQRSQVSIPDARFNLSTEVLKC